MNILILQNIHCHCHQAGPDFFSPYQHLERSPSLSLPLSQVTISTFVKACKCFKSLDFFTNFLFQPIQVQAIRLCPQMTPKTLVYFTLLPQTLWSHQLWCLRAWNMNIARLIQSHCQKLPKILMTTQSKVHCEESILVIYLINCNDSYQKEGKPDKAKKTVKLVPLENIVA